MTRDDHVQDLGLQAVRASLNARPDILLAISKRHSASPLLHPRASPASPESPTPTRTRTAPSLRLCVPRGSPTYDTLGIQLRTNARTVDVDIPLERPSSGRDAQEVKRVVEKMGRDAMRFYGVPETPRVTRYVPPRLISTLVIPPLALLLYLAFAPASHPPAEAGRALVERFLGKWAISSCVSFAAACHLAIEPAIIATKLVRHRTPLITALWYLGTVVGIGYGGMEAFDRAVTYERLRLIRDPPSDSPSESKKSQ